MFHVDKHKKYILRAQEGSDFVCVGGIHIYFTLLYFYFNILHNYIVSIFEYILLVMISVEVDFAAESISIEVSVVAKSRELKLNMPSGKGRLCGVEGAYRWNEVGLIECEVGERLRWHWTDVITSFDVHPQDTNRPPGLVPDTSRRFPCAFFNPSWIPIDAEHISTIAQVRVRVSGNQALLASNRRPPGAYGDGETRLQDGWTVFNGNANFLMIIGDFTVETEGPWRVSYPSTLGPTRAPVLKRLLQNLETAVGYGHPINSEKPDMVFLPLPFLRPDPPDDCCWGHGGNWYCVGSMFVFDLQFLGQSDPLFGWDYRNRRHALSRALASRYIRPDIPGAGDVWIKEALPVVLADLAEAHFLDYGTLELRLAERAQFCMDVHDDPLAECTDLVHCARKGSLVLHEARRLGCDIIKLLTNPTWTRLAELLNEHNVNPQHFSNMWITGVSFPVVSITYVLAARGSKLEMTIERSTQNHHPSSSHWEGGITFEIWGHRKKRDNRRADDYGDERRMEKLDTTTLNFAVHGPSKLEGTLAISGEFMYIKVTDVWIPAEVKIEQSIKAWISSLRTVCDARMQLWIVKALCKQEHFKMLEQVIESKDMHYVIRKLTVSEMYAANHTDPLFAFCDKEPLDEHSKPAYYGALGHIGQMQTPAAIRFIANKIKSADPWAVAAMVGQEPNHHQAQHLSRTLLERDASDPHGVVVSQCIQTLSDPAVAATCLVPMNARSTRLAWNCWKRFCPDSRKWQVDGDPPRDSHEPGYRYPRIVRKRAVQLLKEEDTRHSNRRSMAFSQADQKPHEDLTNEEVQRWLWILENRREQGYDIDAEALSHTMLRPAMRRMRTPARGRLDGGGVSWASKASAAIASMCSFSDSLHFRKTISDFPEDFMEQVYKVKVACPMDLDTVQNKLRAHKYENADEFLDDVELVWKNAETFNGPNSRISLRAAHCRSHFESIYKPPRYS